MAKKQRTNKSKSKKVKEVEEHCDQEVEEHCDQDGQAPSEPQTEKQQSEQETTTNSNSAKRRLGAARGVSSLKKVLVRKAQGKRFKIRYNEFGVPVGDTRCTLQSYIGHLARTMIPIDIDSWPNVDRELKDKLWLDIKVLNYS